MYVIDFGAFYGQLREDAQGSGIKERELQEHRTACL